MFHQVIMFNQLAVFGTFHPIYLFFKAVVEFEIEAVIDLHIMGQQQTKARHSQQCHHARSKFNQQQHYHRPDN